MRHAAPIWGTALARSGRRALAMAWRRSTPATDRLADAVDDMRLRIDELVSDLSTALERAERESRRNRLLGELSSSIDLEELVDRVLDAALEIPGFEAAVVVLEEPESNPTIATRGLTPEEAAHPPTSGIGAGAPARTITVSFRYGPDEQAVPTSLIRGGLFVPLLGRDSSSLGTIALFWRNPEWEPSQRSDRGSRVPRRELYPGDPQRTPLQGGSPARGDRRPHGALQPTLLPRDAAQGSPPRTALRPQPRPDRLRSRRLQVGQ